MKMYDIFDKELDKDQYDISFSGINDCYFNFGNDLFLEDPKNENSNKDSFYRSILIEPQNFTNFPSEITTKTTYIYNKFNPKEEVEKKEILNYVNPKIKNYFQNSNIEEYKKDKDLIPLRKKRVRSYTAGQHNKYSDDNIRRKIKHIVLQSLFNFINNKIKEIYNNNIGKGIFGKQLLKINQKQKSEASIEYNKKFIYKSIGDIFSENITTRYTNYPLTQNKKVINELKNDEEYGNPNYFRNLFSLSFLDGLKHFRGDVYINELEGLEGIEALKDNIKDKEYLKSLEYYIKNFEIIINNKKGRKFLKSDNKEN